MDLPLWVVTEGLTIIEIDGVKPSTDKNLSANQQPILWPSQTELQFDAVCAEHRYRLSVDQLFLHDLQYFAAIVAHAHFPEEWLY